MAAAASDTPMADPPLPDESKSSPPSGWTAVNGRPSPTTADKPASPAAERAAPPAQALSVGEAPPTGISHRLVEDPALTTSPSTEESATTAGRHETPPSPVSVVHVASPNERKRSFDGAFANELRLAASLGSAAAPARSEEQQPTLPTLQPQPLAKAASPQASPHAESRVEEMEPDTAAAHSASSRPLDSEMDPLAAAAAAAAAASTGTNEQDERDLRDSSPNRADSDDNDADQSFASPERDASRTASGVQVDPERTKRRKRVFSNRTKTGCLTCRKRKKKCDEAQPECNNCLRGGFVCEGYSTRSTWVKPSQAKAQPLQSKPTGFSGATAGAVSAPTTGTPQHPHFAPRELQPMEDGRRLSPPRGNSSGGAWGAPPPPHAGPPPHGYAPQQHVSPHQHFREPPPGHEVEHHGPPMYPPNGQMPLHPAHPPPHPNTLPAIQGSIVAGGPPPTFDDPRRPTSGGVRDLTERERMLRGEYYLPYTPALMADREQCALAVSQFNNSTNPATGFRFEDRQRIFAQIVNLRPTPEPHGPPMGREPPPDPQYQPNGGVGPGTVVEGPFGCDYGYNISIGRECVIGSDARINDSCSVTIGDNVVFSRGVRLITGTYAIDPKERKKGKGRTLGRSIVIEDDAWLGPECTILPGVRVGRGSTIGAGSLVHKDVPPFTVMAGNPPKVIRGIYEGMGSPPRS